MWILLAEGVEEMELDNHHRMSYEFDEMVKIYSGGHYDEMRNLLITTKNVIQTLDMLREKWRVFGGASIYFLNLMIFNGLFKSLFYLIKEPV